MKRACRISMNNACYTVLVEMVVRLNILTLTTSIFSKSPGQHIGHVRNVLTLLNNMGVMPRLGKSWLCTETINYLGHWSTSKTPVGRLMHHRRHSQIASTQHLTELRPFLGLYNVFRHFVSNIVRLAALLIKKLRKDGPATFHFLNNKERQLMSVLK